MIRPETAYNEWAGTYDTMPNKTRDLEGLALRKTLADFSFNNFLEIGCGTGKNTEWLVSIAKQVTAVDLSTEMLAKAKAKVKSEKVSFEIGDITKQWIFTEGVYDGIGFSLVLEHVQDLNHIFSEAARRLTEGGFVYIGELHPFKQYNGTKARFDSDGTQKIVECYDHHISDFTQAAKANGFTIVDINEFFDTEDKTSIPRILTILLKKIKGS